MIATLPSGLRGRLLALGLGVLVLAGCWMMVAAPLMGLYARLDGAVQNRGAVARRMALIAETLPELRRQAEARGTAPVATSLLLGATDELAGAALQARVRALATAAGVSLTSTETLPAETVGAFRRIGVEISTAIAWPLLIGLLRDLEQASPTMLVDDMQLQATPGAVASALAVTLTVVAFRAATPP